MAIQDFSLLSPADKEEIFDNKGIFLLSYDVCDAICVVYELFRFYVTFVYEIGANTKADITALVNADELPMLSKINKIL